MNLPTFTVCIPAAGTGERMRSGEAKQYLPLLGIPILIHALRAFDALPACRTLIIATDDEIRVRSLLATYPMKNPVEIVRGGATRQESVLTCLRAVRGNEIVLIHDAARPCITADEIGRVVRATADHRAALLALPARDTIKLSDGAGRVRETLDRKMIFQAQTPQGSFAEIFRAAYEHAAAGGFNVTDDAQALEAMGIPVYIVEGSPTNLKITTRDDLAIAEAILRNRTD